MLRWSSGRALVAVFCFAALAAQAQDTGTQSPGVPGSDTPGRFSGNAYLVAGPVRGQGIDFLAPNVVPFWLGTYSVGAAQVSVYFMDLLLPEAAGWQRVPCAQRVLRSNADGLAHYFAGDGWSIVVTVSARIGAVPATGSGATGAPVAPDGPATPDGPGSEESPALPVDPSFACAFVDRFVERYLFFQRVEGARDEPMVMPPAFPAVLELQ